MLLCCKAPSPISAASANQDSGNDAAASDGLADTSMLTDAEEYVTVHGDGFNNSYYIRKSYLIEASGFFKKMFEHDYQV